MSRACNLFPIYCGRAIVLFLIGMAGILQAQEDLSPGNDQIILGLFQNDVLSTIENSLDPKALIISDIQPASPLSVWLKTKLTQACLNKDYVVYSSADSADSAPLLRVVQPTLQIAYKTAGRNWFLRTKEYARRIVMKMQLEVVAADGKVLVSKPVTVVYEDRITRSELERLQNSPQSFLRGTKSDSGLIKRWLEPVTTTLATATVIYLFYSLRSD